MPSPNGLHCDEDCWYTPERIIFINLDRSTFDKIIGLQSEGIFVPTIQSGPEPVCILDLKLIELTDAEIYEQLKDILIIDGPIRSLEIENCEYLHLNIED